MRKWDYPPVSLPAKQYMEGARKIWEELGLPSLTPQSPWHGYSLGDWDDLWTLYAKRATTGEWDKSGAETYERRRGGLTPETPTRQIERGKKD